MTKPPAGSTDPEISVGTASSAATAATAALELFAYWHVPPAQAAAAEGAARAWQGRLRAGWPGLHAALYRRDDTPRGRVTFMETYAQAGGLAGVTARVLTAGEPSLVACTGGARHLEWFSRVER